MHCPFTSKYDRMQHPKATSNRLSVNLLKPIQRHSSINPTKGLKGKKNLNGLAMEECQIVGKTLFNVKRLDENVFHSPMESVFLQFGTPCPPIYPAFIAWDILS